jgi:chromosome segregation ATPase
MRWIWDNIPKEYQPRPEMIINNDHEPMAALEQDRKRIEEFAIAMYYKMQADILKAHEIWSGIANQITDEKDAELAAKLTETTSLQSQLSEKDQKIEALTKSIDNWQREVKRLEGLVGDKQTESAEYWEMINQIARSEWDAPGELVGLAKQLRDKYSQPNTQG